MPLNREAMGIEIFANDLENIRSMQLWAAVAIALTAIIIIF